VLSKKPGFPNVAHGDLLVNCLIQKPRALDILGCLKQPSHQPTMFLVFHHHGEPSRKSRMNPGNLFSISSAELNLGIQFPWEADSLCPDTVDEATEIGIVFVQVFGMSSQSIPFESIVLHVLGYFGETAGGMFDQKASHLLRGDDCEQHAEMTQANTL
jgi:hypothetical protein